MGAHLPSNVNHYFHDCFLVMSSRYHFCRCQYINITDANIMILRYRYLNEKTMFLGRSYTPGAAILDLARTSLAHDGSCRQSGFWREDLMFFICLQWKSYFVDLFGNKVDGNRHI